MDFCQCWRRSRKQSRQKFRLTYSFPHPKLLQSGGAEQKKILSKQNSKVIFFSELINSKNNQKLKDRFLNRSFWIYLVNAYYLFRKYVLIWGITPYYFVLSWNFSWVADLNDDVFSLDSLPLRPRPSEVSTSARMTLTCFSIFIQTKHTSYVVSASPNKRYLGRECTSIHVENVTLLQI